MTNSPLSPSTSLSVSQLAAGYASDAAAAVGLFTAAVTILTTLVLALLGGIGALPEDPALLMTLYGATT
jgi:hypothetical protein